MHRIAVEQDRTTQPKGQSHTEQPKSDLETRSPRAETTESSLAVMRRRLAQAEHALAKCSYEAAETAGKIAAAREELHLNSVARDEAEKISAGLKQHVELLMADVKEWHVAFAAVQQARIAETAETQRTTAALAGEVKQVLAVLDTSRLDLAVRLDDAESAHARQTAELEVRLQRQAGEIEMLRQVVEDKQHEAEHERSGSERLRQAAAGAVGRAAGLLNGHSASSV